MRILIAEDDFTCRNMLAAVLKKAGHEPLETFDGDQALQELQKPDAPRLVILDWMMPEIDGLEVLRRVRAVPTERPPYILMLTTKTEKAEIIAGLDAGADDYLTKPFDPGELQARVEVGRRMVEMQDELAKSMEALKHQASHDPLTGLLNRRAILDRLRTEFERAGRHSEALSVGMCDIDHFKAINDTYGHQTGDDVLCELSKSLVGSSRKYDSVGRMGGEEFLIIAPTEKGKVGAPHFERICASIAKTKMETRSGSLFVTVSIGVATGTSTYTTDDLLKEADAAMYRAKAEGRNRVVWRVTALETGVP